MTNAKMTRRALLSSVLALVLCFTMLLGTTFAWFTDEAVSSGNKIVAGNLDVQLLLKDSNGDYQDIGEKKAPIFGINDDESLRTANDNNADTLWEPGKTQVAYLAVKNNGNLALKYQVALTVTDPDGKALYKVMQYAIVPNEQTSVDPWSEIENKTSPALGTQIITTDVSLSAQTTHYFALVIHMNEEAGNDYKNAQLSFDLTVLATQDTAESDSFNTEYDKDATYPTHFARTADELMLAIANVAPGDVIKLDNVDFGKVDFSSISTSEDASELKDITIVGSGNTRVAFTGINQDVVENITLKDLIITGELSFGSVKNSVNNITIENVVFKSCKGLNLLPKDAKNITYRGCTFDGGYNGIATWSSINNLVIDGCTFKNTSSWPITIQAYNAESNYSIPTYVFTNNTFIDCGQNRCMKIAGLGTEGASVTFTGNNFVFSKDGATPVFEIAWDYVTESGTTINGEAYTIIK